MRNAILRELMTEYEQLRAADAIEEERRRREQADRERRRWEEWERRNRPQQRSGSGPQRRSSYDRYPDDYRRNDHSGRSDRRR